jgi:hypothetical protein
VQPPIFADLILVVPVAAWTPPLPVNVYGKPCAACQSALAADKFAELGRRDSAEFQRNSNGSKLR